MSDKISLKNIFRNSMWQICEKILTMIISIFITSLIARYLGSERYGTVNYVISVVMLFTAFSTLGMEKITINDIIDKKNKVGEILGTSFFIRIIGGVILIFISQLTLYILDGSNFETQILGIIMGTSILFKAFEVIEYYFQAKMKFKMIALIRFCTAIVVALFKVLVVIFDFGMIGFISSYLVDAVTAAILFFIVYKNGSSDKWKLNKAYAKSILSRCWYVAIAGLMTTIYMRIDQVMLGSMFEEKSQNGIYSAAVRIAEMWYFVPTAVISAFQPIIIKRKKEEDGVYESTMQKLYDLVSIIGVSFAILISIFSDLAVDILYGAEYAQASNVLTISVWAGLFATLGTARSVWLIIEHLEKYTIIYTLSGCVINIALNAILIPTYGAFGAAFATLITQFISNIFILMIFKKTRKSSFMILKSIFNNKVIFGAFKELYQKIKRKMLLKIT